MGVERLLLFFFLSMLLLLLLVLELLSLTETLEDECREPLSRLVESLSLLESLDFCLDRLSYLPGFHIIIIT